jgi:hypothetical protein
VGIRYDGGGSPGNFLFTDNYTRANGGVGPNYYVMPTGASLQSINGQEGMWGVNANQGQLNNTTGSNQTMHGWLFPYANPQNTLGLTQFMEIKVTLISAIQAFGIAVMGTPIGDAGYFMRVNAGAPNNLQLCLTGGAGMDGLTIQAGFDGGIPWALNDIIRLSVIPGVASNTVKSWINGVTVATRIDSTAGRPVLTQGMPALGCGQSLIGAVSMFDNMRCGAGEGG